MPDEIAKLFAGHMGVAAVLVNVLIDKGIIDRDELLQRFEQAYDVATQSSGGIEVAQVLGEMLSYLGNKSNGRPKTN